MYLCINKTLNICVQQGKIINANTGNMNQCPCEKYVAAKL